MLKISTEGRLSARQVRGIGGEGKRKRVCVFSAQKQCSALPPMSLHTCSDSEPAGGFQVSLKSKSFKVKSQCTKRRGNADVPRKNGAEPRWPLAPPEHPVDSGPSGPVCTQHCPALTFYEATCRNPRPSQTPLFFSSSAAPATRGVPFPSIRGPGALMRPLGLVTEAGHTV